MTIIEFAVIAMIVIVWLMVGLAAILYDIETYMILAAKDYPKSSIELHEILIAIIFPFYAWPVNIRYRKQMLYWLDDDYDH